MPFFLIVALAIPRPHGHTAPATMTGIVQPLGAVDGAAQDIDTGSGLAATGLAATGLAATDLAATGLAAIAASRGRRHPF
jgi:hypothetical protein